MSLADKLKRTIRLNQVREADLAFALRARSPNAIYLAASRLEKSGALIRLKNGLYVWSPEYRTQPIELFAVANHLYGPSYISFETALAWHGLIPERVYTIMSSNPKRTKRFKTSIALFEYRKLPAAAFPIGLTRIELSGQHCLIATPEKALLDKLYLDYHHENMLGYLQDSLRIEPEDLTALNKQMLQEYHEFYQNALFSSRVKQFLKSY